MIRYLTLALMTCFMTLPMASAHAADATTIWKTVLKKCAKSDLLGRQQLFFGLSNAAGPGSVWSYADDRSIRLEWELSDAFPNEADRAKVILPGLPVPCKGDKGTEWSLKFGLPFTTGGSPISADIAAVLGTASHVSVSVTSFTIDQLKLGPWRDSLKTLDESSSYGKVLNQPGGLIAVNGLRVSGLKAVFTFKGTLAAGVQAKFKNANFQLGTEQAPAPTITTPAQTSAGAPAQMTPESGAPSASTAGNSNTAGTDPCTAAAVATVPGMGTSVPSTTIAGAATLRADVVSGNQIIMCALGAPYILAAYSKVKQGGSLGVGPNEDVVLQSAKVATNAVVRP